jgi:hypothetical protein
VEVARLISVPVSQENKSGTSDDPGYIRRDRRTIYRREPPARSPSEARLMSQTAAERKVATHMSAFPLDPLVTLPRVDDVRLFP